jgi:hypothetical protein
MTFTRGRARAFEHTVASSACLLTQPTDLKCVTFNPGSTDAYKSRLLSSGAMQ